MSNIIKFIRGAEADIPVLNQGEPAFTTDTHKVFVGDGAANHPLMMADAPELEGELDCGAHSVGFTIQTLTGDGTDEIDWKIGNYMSFTCPAGDETFTFVAPSNPCGLTLQIKQDGVGGRDLTFPAAVKWLGTEPTWTDGGAGKTIIMSMRYDGTNYWANATPWEA